MKTTVLGMVNRTSFAILTASICVALTPITTYGAPPPHASETDRPAHSREQGPPEHANNEQSSVQGSSNKTCQQKKQTIDKAKLHFSTQAERHLAVFDRIHERVQSFYDRSQLSDPDYEDLNSAVSLAHQNTTEKLANLNSSESVTCEESSIDSADIRTINDQAKDIVNDLKMYRSSLVLLIQSLRAEIADDNSPQTESTDNSSDNQSED